MSNNTYDIALTIEEAKEMNLLDEVKFKYFSDYCEDDFIYGTADYDIRSEDTPQWENEVNIKLELDWNEGTRTQEIEIYRRYNTSSPFAMKMLDWINEEEEEEEEEQKELPEEILCGGCGKNDMRNYYKFPCLEDRCSDCEEEEEEEEQKELPEELKEWVLENMKAVEEQTLEEDKAMLFLNLIEENQHNPIYIKLYDEYEKSKN